mmetsp:Transcript_53558/g.120754  ORF Transcript_53558/g.120754 Transcript_53558/m.120754 type:complete len:187 (+) Transcript_53558:76-636(+)
MGPVSASSCQPALATPPADTAHLHPVDLRSSSRCPAHPEATTCCGACPKEGTREVRDFHEYKAVQWKDRMGKEQMLQAQRVVDRTLRQLLLGCRVRADGRDGARLLITPDLRTLEVEWAKDSDGEVRRHRAPLSQVVDVSFGVGVGNLVLRFNESLCRESLELSFAGEDQRLEVALTLKVLRSRLA